MYKTDTLKQKEKSFLSESFDYTEWRRDHLPEEADVCALSRKAAEYAKKLDLA